MAAVEPHRLAAPASAGMYARHYGRVLSYCQWRLGKREDAEDAAQATFLNAHEALSRGTTPRSEASWLLAIANNVCLARWRAQRGRPGEIAQEPEALATHAAPELDAELLPALRAAIELLPEQQRQAFVMREWHGCSYAEIAAELGTTEAAVASLVFRARQSLAAALGDERPRRRFGNFGAGSTLGWLKSLLGGTAAKLAVAGSVLVVAAGSVATSHPPRHGPAHAARPHVAAAALALPTRPARLAHRVSTTRAAARARTAARPTPSPQFSHAPSRRTAPAIPVVAPRPVSVSPSPPPADPAPAPSPAPPAPTPQPAAPIATPPAPALPPPPPLVTQVVGTATQTVGQVQTVADSLPLPKLGR
jgi:RNA polymerase sigma-70 factor (ECF subfamily)